MAINPDDMKLTKSTYGIDPAWKWIAPTGKVFHLQNLWRYGMDKWYWFDKRYPNNGGDGGFKTLKELKAYIARFFDEDEEQTS